MKLFYKWKHVFVCVLSNKFINSPDYKASNDKRRISKKK
jgi:hypothetical protein